MKTNNRINPTGLKGNQVLDRMRELMGKTINESTNNSVVELTKVGPNGIVYGIVRENHEYYIKTSEKKSGLVTEDFNYMGGLKNKKSEAYPTYAKAIKHLNLKFLSINESFGGEKVNVFENDNLMEASAGSMGFVGEMEDTNYDHAIVDKKTSGDNLDGEFDENPIASSTNTGDHKAGEQGHDTEIMKEEDGVELTEDEVAIDEMITGESLDKVGDEDCDVNNDGKEDEQDDYLVNKRLKIGKAMAIGENDDKLTNLVDTLSESETKALIEALKKKV
jgi:hypothetical protein